MCGYMWILTSYGWIDISLALSLMDEVSLRHVYMLLVAEDRIGNRIMQHDSKQWNISQTWSTYIPVHSLPSLSAFLFLFLSLSPSLSHSLSLPLSPFLSLPSLPPPLSPSPSVHQVLTIHLGFPPGDILVFMTGQEDIEATCQVCPLRRRTSREEEEKRGEGEEMKRVEE